MPEPFRVISTCSEEDTRLLGESLGRRLPGGSVIILAGPLGAGKTVLARGIARGLGVTQPVSSPSFVLVREYEGRDGMRIYHWDAYRLSGPEDLDNLPMEEHLAEDSVILLEWGDRLRDWLPSDSLVIRLTRPDPRSPDKRHLELSGGDRYRSLVEEALSG